MFRAGRLRLLIVLVAVFVALGCVPAGAAVTCGRFASPAGSDSSGDGSQANPYQTVSKLDASLSAGQTGCLRAGTYGDTSTHHQLATSGSAGAQVTITSYPGERAKLVGWVDMTGSYTTLSYVDIDGSNTFYTVQRSGTNCPYPISEGLHINGHDTTFEHNNYYQSRQDLYGNGIGIGWSGTPDRTIVRYNRIHDLGQCKAFDHNIYGSPRRWVVKDAWAGPREQGFRG